MNADQKLFYLRSSAFICGSNQLVPRPPVVDPDEFRLAVLQQRRVDAFGAEAAHFAGLDVEARVVDQARAVDGDAAAIQALRDGGGALDVPAKDSGAQRVRRLVRQGDGVLIIARGD